MTNILHYALRAMIQFPVIFAGEYFHQQQPKKKQTPNKQTKKQEKTNKP
jgi:uncharacterized membrane protein affecting hemolysin expression